MLHKIKRRHLTTWIILIFLFLLQGSIIMPSSAQVDIPYPIVDTNQTYCFSDTGVITCGASFNGQDAQYAGLQPSYQDNGDGTISDLNTGLMWLQDPGSKTNYNTVTQNLASYSFAGYSDWRLPTIKELYSLTQFNGMDPSNLQSSDVEGLQPFIDDSVFVFLYGDESGGARVIDSQWLTDSVYVSTVFNGQSCFFGFNFADGRIKCYPLQPGGSSGYFALLVRGNESYGINDFVDNADGTISDNATGLTWTQNDSATGMMWGDALTYCESLSLAGFDDWRLPNIKELQSIIDYSRSPDTTGSPAIDPIFMMTSITNELGQVDYPYFWSSTTHIGGSGDSAAYISFGRALGYMDEFGGYLDVHGAGAQRSDPKSGNPSDYPITFGPQGDVRRLMNYARCVRGGIAEPSTGDDPATFSLPAVMSGNGQGQPPSDAQGQPPSDGQTQPPQGQTQGQQGNAPDIAAAAQQLGISEQQLRDALGTSNPPDLRAAAETLGITVRQLEDALGISPP